MLHPRARTMLLLSLPAVAIGIASSLILIVVMKIASVLQNLLWQRLPSQTTATAGRGGVLSDKHRMPAHGGLLKRQWNY